MKAIGFSLFFLFFLLFNPTSALLAANPQYLDDLQKLIPVNTPALERTLLNDAKDGQLSVFSLAEAALIASGSWRQSDFSRMSEKVSLLEKKVTTRLRSLPEKERARQLLVWLHDSVLSEYLEKQSSLSTLLDNGQYNCVSITVLYNALGQMLDLPLGAISTEKHVFSVLLAPNKLIDIETTTKHGFDPSIAVADELKQKTGFTRITEEESDGRRRITSFELIALIYFNRALTAIDKLDYEAGLLLFAKALVFDQHLTQAKSSMISLLAVHSANLLKAHAYQDALHFIELGLQYDPNNTTLLHNQTAGWHNYALFAAKEKSALEAIDVVKKAYLALGTDALLDLQAQLFITEATNYAKKQQWQVGYKTLLTGQKLVSSAAKEILEKWIEHYLVKWSIGKIEQKEYQDAYLLLEQILSRNPQNQVALGNISFVLQEWSREIAKNSSIEKAKVQVDIILEKYKDSPKVKAVATHFMIWSIKALLKKKQFQQALTYTHEVKPLIDSPRFHQVMTVVIDQWSQAYVEQKQWKKAIQVYQVGQLDSKNNDVLIENEKYTWNEWGRALIKMKQFKQAKQVFLQALSRYPNDETFTKNLDYVQRQTL